MKFCIVNGKQFDVVIDKLAGLTFKSGLSYNDVDFSTKTRSITDLILICISSGMSEKEISKFGIDPISVAGKVSNQITKTKEKFFEIKNKKIVLTDLGKDRISKI